MANETNWVEIKMCYVTSEKKLSYGELANLFNVSKTAVYNKCKEEGWETERENYMSKMMTVIQEVTIRDKAKRTERSLNMVGTLIDISGKRLLKEISVNSKDVSINQLIALMELERKLGNNELGSNTPKKKIYKRLDQCTAKELDEVISGEAIVLTNADIEEL